MAVKNLSQAQKALEQHVAITEQIEALEKKHKIDEMRKKATALKDEATAWAAGQEGLERIELEDEAYAAVVRQKYGAHWITVDEDMDDEEPSYARSLASLLEEKFGDSITTKGSKARKMFLKLTRRVVDPGLVETQVALGKITVDEIALAFVEKDKKPYLRVYRSEE